MTKTVSDIQKVAEDILNMLRHTGLNALECCMAITMANEINSAWHSAEFTRKTLGLSPHNSEECEDCKNDKTH